MRAGWWWWRCSSRGRWKGRGRGVDGGGDDVNWDGGLKCVCEEIWEAERGTKSILAAINQICKRKNIKARVGNTIQSPVGDLHYHGVWKTAVEMKCKAIFLNSMLGKDSRMYIYTAAQSAHKPAAHHTPNHATQDPAFVPMYRSIHVICFRPISLLQSSPDS